MGATAGDNWRDRGERTTDREPSIQTNPHVCDVLSVTLTSPSAGCLWGATTGSRATQRAALATKYAGNGACTGMLLLFLLYDLARNNISCDSPFDKKILLLPCCCGLACRLGLLATPTPRSRAVSAISIAFQKERLQQQ